MKEEFLNARVQARTWMPALPDSPGSSTARTLYATLARQGGVMWHEVSSGRPASSAQNNRRTAARRASASQPRSRPTSTWCV